MIGMALSLAGGVAEMAAQQEQADNQNKLHEQNRLNALAAFTEKQNSLNMRISQERDAAGQQKMDNALEARAARATNEVAAGENMVSGHSVDALQRDIFSKEQRFNDRVNTNTDWTVQQIQSQKKGTAYEAQDRINSVRKADNPNFAGLLIKSVAGGLNGITGAKTKSTSSSFFE